MEPVPATFTSDLWRDFQRSKIFTAGAADPSLHLWKKEQTWMRGPWISIDWGWNSLTCLRHQRITCLDLRQFPWLLLQLCDWDNLGINIIGRKQLSGRSWTLPSDNCGKSWHCLYPRQVSLRCPNQVRSSWCALWTCTAMEKAAIRCLGQFSWCCVQHYKILTWLRGLRQKQN